MFRRFYGPTHEAFEALPPDAQGALAYDIGQLLKRNNRAGPAALSVPSEYLEVVIATR